MADQEFAIKLTADATQFKEGIDQAKESLATIGDLIGIKVPDSVQKLLASSELVGPALEAAFTPLAVISLIKSIADFIENLKKQREELEQQTHAAFEAADSIGKMAESLRLGNLRLEDQISALQRTPARNGIAIVLGEAGQRADDLAASINKAISAENKLLNSLAQGYLARLILPADGLQKIANDLADGKKRYDDERAEIEDKRVMDVAERNEKEVVKDREKYKQKLEEYRKFLGQQQTAIETWRKQRANDLQQDSVDTGPFSTGVIPGESADQAMKDATLEAKDLQRALNDVRAKVLDGVTAFKELKQNTDLGIKEKYAQAERTVQDFFDKALHAHSKLADAVKKQNEEEAKGEVEAANAAARVEESFAREAEHQLKAWDEQTKRAEKISQLTRDVQDAQAEHNAKLAVALGYMTEEKAAEQAIIQLESDKQAALDPINARLAEQIPIVKKLGEETLNGLLGSPEQKAAYQKAVTDYQNLKIQQLQLEKKYDDQIAALQLKLANTFSAQLRKQMQEWQDIHKQLGQTFMSTINSMNSSLAQFVVTGQANWKQLAASAIEEIVKIGLQWAESQITMMILGKTTGKETAGSNIMASAASGAAAAGASVAAIPVIGWSMVEAVSAATYGLLSAYEAGIAGFALGGIVPATGLALVHRGERILPASMSGTGLSAGDVGGNHVHLHAYVSAIDSKDVNDFFDRHMHRLLDRAAKHLKRRGFGTK